MTNMQEKCSGSTRKPTAEDAEQFVRATFGASFAIMQEMFLTGSVAFDEAGEDSDIDLAVSVMFRQDVESYLEAACVHIDRSDYNSGVHADVKFGGDTLRVNFVFLHPLDYAVWRRAGEIYKSLPHQCWRQQRHAMFQTIVAMVKTSFALAGVEVTRDNYTVLSAPVPIPVIVPKAQPTTYKAGDVPF
jgi:predicted nucleotidyltransferase